MSDNHLTADELLAGAQARYAVTIPADIVQPGQATPTARELVVQLQPITIGTFQLIMRAAKQDSSLIPLLLIKEALVEPSLSLEQVKRMHLGMVDFLIAHIREISGMTEKKSH